MSLKDELTIWSGVPRQLVAGVQPKIVVTKKGDELFFPGESLSTHILKFETDSDNGIAINEFVTMTLARLVGINVADVEMRKFGDHAALLVTRFDRMLVDGLVRGVHVIDSCQALNLAPEYKYERNFGDGSDVRHIRDGVSLPMIFKLAKMADSVQEVVDWVLFNLIVGNWDSHGKNISFYYDSNELKVAPFYDLVNIEAFGKYSSNLSMAIGDEFNGNEINAYQLAEMCVDCGLHPELVASSLKRLSQKVSESLTIIARKAPSSLGGDG